MNQLYLITRWLTLPGAMVRACVEQITCRICAIPVEDNRIIRNDELFGHVEHELAPTARKSFALCFVPAFVNFLLAMLLFLPSLLSLFFMNMTGWLMILVNAVAYYLGVSIMSNSYPLIEDALNMKEKIYDSKNVWLKIIYSIGFAFLYVLSFAEKYCLTFLFWICTTVFFLVSA